MAIPAVVAFVRDGGLGVTTAATSIPHIFGVCDDGPSNVPTLIGDDLQLRDVFGNVGPLIDSTSRILGNGGGPVLVTRVTASVAGDISAIVASGAGPTIADNSSDPLNHFEVVITITKGGALGTSEYIYSLDGNLSVSGALVTAAGVTLDNTGIDLTFAAGTYVVGETYTFSTTAPHYNSTNLGTFYDAVTVSEQQFDFFIATGQPVDAEAGALLAATHVTRLNTLFNSFQRPYRLMMNGGEDVPATFLTEYVNFVGERVAVLYGEVTAPAPSGTLGRAFAFHPVVTEAGIRATGNVISTDLMQVSGAQSVGALPGVVAISHNEYTTPAGLDAAKIGTTRTMMSPRRRGYFLTNVHLRSAVGSDFQFWQHGRIMDVACIVATGELEGMLGRGFSTNADGTGTLTEASAQKIENQVQKALDDVLGNAIFGQGPTTVDGEFGHVSRVRFQVSRTNNFLSTNTIIATVSIVPRGYAKRIEVTLSYTLQA